MEVSVFGYADVGSQTGEALTQLGRELDRRGYLRCVYARGVEQPAGFHTTTPIPGGRTLPRMLTGVNRIVPAFPHRALSERLFDHYASKRMSANSSDVHLHYIPGHVKTFNRAASSGVPVVVRGSTELNSAAQSRLMEEAWDAGIEIRLSAHERKRAELREKTLSESDRIIALSQFVKRSFVNAGINDGKIDVVPLGVDTADFPTSERAGDTFTALFVGRVTLLKGVRYLLNAWESLDWTGSELILCGDISHRLKPLLRDVPETVNFVGYDDPRRYLGNADVFVFPSLSEGFAKAPLEAMAAGVPVIVSSNSGVDDIMTNGKEGFVVPPADEEAIKAKLTYLRDHPAEARSMGRKGLETARAYTWERHVDGVVEVLQGV